ncbi:MAG: S41 family peptidase [Lachnospiraceae bacterium]|nr:S41 family peptidase [Lachnospiraceae bacterium]
MEENSNYQEKEPQQQKESSGKSFQGVKKGLIAGVLVGAAFIIGRYSTGVGSASVGSNAIITSEVSKKAESIQKVIDAYYLEEENVEDVKEGVYKGMVDALGDPYSVYFTKEEYDSFKESYTGEYCGIGASLLQDAETGIITIVKAFEGSPAKEAGLMTDDILYKVNEEEVTGQDLSEVVAKVKGLEDTTVKLTIVRDSEEIEMEVARKTISIPTVESEMLENNIGYILISEFDEVTTSQYAEAYNSLKSQGMKSLIVDLRNNPGGGLSVVAEILDSVLPEGMIVYHEDKNGYREEYKSDAEHQIDIPLVVLVNGNSASASEIFAGAVKDYGIGTLIGTKTFGKGVVQQMIDLGDGSAMKVTISKYFTPNGVCIHGTGIEPDIELEFDSESYKKDESDNQLKKAIEVLNGSKEQ